MKRLNLLLLLLVALVVSAPAPALREAAYRTENAVIVVIDGPRQSEMWGDPQRRNIPRMASNLAPEGVLLAGLRNGGPTYTNAGHAALCTGAYQHIENTQGTQLPSRVGMFQRFLRASGLPASQAWIIASKDKLAILADTTEPGWTGKYRPSVWTGKGGRGLGSGYAEDADTLAAAKTVMTRDHPRLVLVSFKEPDPSGHSGRWADYTQAIRGSDARAADLWQFLQTNAFYRQRTAYFVTHDHGRHLDGVSDGFTNHGDDCEGCRNVALLALGPDFKRGVTFPKGGELVDVSVTVAHLLRFQMPGSHGRVLRELFR